MSTMNSEVYAALIDAGADQTKAIEAAKSVAQYDRDIGDIRESLSDLKTSVADIRGSLRIMQWMFGFTLAFVVALTFHTFTNQ